MSEHAVDMWGAAQRIDDAMSLLSSREKVKALHMAAVSAGIEVELALSMRELSDGLREHTAIMTFPSGATVYGGSGAAS